MSYTKLFHSIITSTIWLEDDKTRIVWITMLAMKDKNGEVFGSIPGLARIAGVDVESCRNAIAKFLSPDVDSRTKDDEGRRISEIDGGWHVNNHDKYRDMESSADRAEKATQRQRKKRDRDKARHAMSHAVTPCHKKSHQNCHTDTDTDIEEAAAAVVAGATLPHDAPASSVSPVRDEVPSEQIIAAFDETFGTKSRLTPKRKTSLRARWGEKWWQENWKDALMRAAESEFLRGDNDRGWTITIDFFLKPDTATHILEGKYDARQGNGWKNNPAQQRENGNAHAFAAYFGRIAKNSKDRSGDDEALCVEGPDPVY